VLVCFHGREVENTNIPLAEFAYNNSYQLGSAWHHTKMDVDVFVHFVGI
jgi:hypothetical protein